MRRSIMVIALLGLGCSGRQPPPPPAAALPPPPPAPLYTDGERITRIATTPGAIWGITATGPIRWDRRTGQAVDEGARGAPKDAGAIAENGGVLYVGTAGALHMRGTDGRWVVKTDAPARAGVVDLVPRKKGGVWMATPGALASVANGQIRIRTRRYKIRDLAVGPQGTLWLATRAHGLVQLSNDRFIEHTTAQGVACNDVRHVAIAPTGRLVATCAQGTTITTRDSNRWAAYRLAGVGSTLLAVWPHGAELVLQTPGRWFRMGPAVPTAKPPAMAVTAFDPTRQPAPPPPAKIVAPPSLGAPVKVAAPPSTAPASVVSVTVVPGTPASTAVPSAQPVAPPSVPKVSVASVIVMPPPVPLPPPIAPPPSADATFISVRAQPARLVPTPSWQLRDADDLRPADGAPTASLFTPDGAVLHAIAYRGIVLRQGTQRRRYVTQSLMPAAPARLIADRNGHAVLLTAKGQVYRFDGKAFTPWTVPGNARIIGISAGKGSAYALSYVPPPPPPAAPPSVDPTEPDLVDPSAGPSPPPPPPAPAQLIVYRSDTQGPFTETARVALPPLKHPPRIGRMVVQNGRLSFPLFEAPDDQTLRAVGLAQVTNGTIEIWRAQLGYEGEDAKNVLPDAWVNALALDMNGAFYVATNAGLVQVTAAKRTVFDENDFIDSEVMLDVAIDAKGAVWVGTFEGLGALVDGKWRAEVDVPFQGRINALATTPDGSVWVGTDEGLHQRAPEGRWQTHGVPGRGVIAITDLVPDGKGGLWLMTAEGLVRWTP